MLALAKAKVSTAQEPIAYVYEKSASQDRLGMKLIAARALAMFGDYRGKATAIYAIQFRTTRLGLAASIRTLATHALAEMKDPTVLNYLARALADELTGPASLPRRFAAAGGRSPCRAADLARTV